MSDPTDLQDAPPAARRRCRRRPGAPSPRRIQIVLAMTAVERQTLCRRAALARLPLRDFVRAAVLRSPAPPSALPVVAIRIYGCLGRTAVDLDRVLLELRTEPDAAPLLPCLETLAAELAELRRQLAGLPTAAAPGVSS